MVTREERLAGFETAIAPAASATLELLCEDHNGTYVLPFPCRMAGGEWRNARSGELIEAQAIGWRDWGTGGGA